MELTAVAMTVAVVRVPRVRLRRPPPEHCAPLLLLWLPEPQPPPHAPLPPGHAREGWPWQHHPPWRRTARSLARAALAPSVTLDAPRDGERSEAQSHTRRAANEASRALENGRVAPVLQRVALVVVALALVALVVVVLAVVARADGTAAAGRACCSAFALCP